MKYYKNTETGEVFAYESEQARHEWGAPEQVEMTPEEVDAHLNPAPTRAETEAAERAWRDMQIMSVEWMRDRHRDQLEIGAPTTLTAGQYQELLQYMQDLRDWPQSAEFPAQEYRPVPVEWMLAQAGDLH